MPALLLIDPTPYTVNYLILGYMFLIGLPVLYVLSWYARQRSLKRDLDTIESLAADERKRATTRPAAPPTTAGPAAQADKPSAS